MESLIDYIRSTVSPQDYYSSVFDNLSWAGVSEARTLCPFHDDKATPSFHMNPQTGAWYCHGCGIGGQSIISFEAKHNGGTKYDAASRLFKQFVRPVIDDKQIYAFRKALRNTPTALKYLTEQRLFTDAVIDSFELGWDGVRFTFPIRNEFGLCVNVKYYDATASRRIKRAKAKDRPAPFAAKMLNHRVEGETRSFGSPPMLYPVKVLEWAKKVGYIVVAEGEADTIFLISIGIPAITSTAGAKSWCKAYNEKFRGLTVIIAYDNDKDGKRYDKIVLKNLRKYAKVIKRLAIPKEVGKDITDWARADATMRYDEAWIEAFRKAKVLLENPDEYIEQSEVKNVPLDQATRSEWYNRRIRVQALVTGKDDSPYLLPKHARMTCNRKCERCPLLESEKEYREVQISPSDPRVLGMVDSSDQAIKRTMCALGGFEGSSSDCNVQVEPIETFNIEHLLLIPSIDDAANSQYVTQPAFYVGHGLHTNRYYQFEGITVPNPKDQHATHLFDKAKPAHDEIETFHLTPAQAEALHIFRPGRIDIIEHLRRIAEWQSIHITKIRERYDLHIGVDLVYHSIASFRFNQEMVPRGMLDLLIIGDSRCGKGYVAEGLKRYYGLGEVASGDACSFAGLVGGVQQTERRNFITWGLIPLNHGRAVIIDEMSSLPEQTISSLTRIRSEGIAEITKIKRHVTNASTRLIWLSNPRSGRSMETYDEGVEAIKELVGANEDISRFDCAITVAKAEVDAGIINSRPPQNGHLGSINDYPRDLCRALILWAWSRRPDQVVFTSEAERLILAEAIKMGQQYSARIPLVQAENVRVKIAKIAAAVAARTFSTDKSHETLIVDEDHVQAACTFMRECFNKSSMGYDRYSRRIAQSSTIKTNEPIAEVLENLDQLRDDAMRGLLETHRITTDALTDFVGDSMVARTLIGDLVRFNCLIRMEGRGGGPGWYLKNPAFSEWLRSNRKELRYGRRSITAQFKR